MNNALMSGAIAGLVLFLLGLLGKRFFKADPKSPLQKKEEVHDAVKNTPATDLVAAAANANELRADAAGIAGKFIERLRRRSGAILSGNDSDPADGNSGRGDGGGG